MQESDRKFGDILIAIHGIGDQIRNETMRSVATRLARIEKLGSNKKDGKAHPLVAPQPLGFFYSDVGEIGGVFPVDRDVHSGSELAKIGFAEVYWADLPQEAVDDGHTLDESKAWARTVTSRARAAYYRWSEKETPTRPTGLEKPDFTLIAEVLDEIIDTIYVLESLCFLAKKAGLFDFDLRKVLEQFVGDVQVVAEFRFFRRRIIGRLHEALARIHHEHPDASLHIVAHSEGTVVGFLGLLEAMAGRTWKPDPASDTHASRLVPDSPAWLAQVKGYLTIGSPLDKHIVLWPELFEGYAPLATNNPVKDGQIRWRNYYDYGDPVGFMLDTTRQWLTANGIKAFEFDDTHDFGFARYLLPGKAHNDYWNDSAVFEHFVSEAIPQSGILAGPPAQRTFVRIVSPCLPYVASFIVLFFGTVLFFKAVVLYMHAPLDSVQRYVHWKVLGSYPESDSGYGVLLQEGLGVTLLIAGLTLFARWPRLSKQRRWWWLGAAAFTLGCVSYVTLVTAATRADIGSIFSYLRQFGSPFPAQRSWLHSVWTATAGLETGGTLLSALAVAWVGRWGIKAPRATQEKRRMRWFRKQMRPLLTSGGLALAVLVGYQLAHPGDPLSLKERDDIIAQFSAPRHTLRSRLGESSTLPDAEATKAAAARVGELSRLLQAHPPVWPVFLAGIAFMYLWWLSALIFDLAFVWQWYIRHSVMLEKLKQWRMRDASTTEAGGGVSQSAR